MDESERSKVIENILFRIDSLHGESKKVIMYTTQISDAQNRDGELSVVHDEKIYQEIVLEKDESGRFNQYYGNIAIIEGVIHNINNDNCRLAAALDSIFLKDSYTIAIEAKTGEMGVITSANVYKDIIEGTSYSKNLLDSSAILDEKNGTMTFYVNWEVDILLEEELRTVTLR